MMCSQTGNCNSCIHKREVMLICLHEWEVVMVMISLRMGVCNSCLHKREVVMLIMSEMGGCADDVFTNGRL